MYRLHTCDMTLLYVWHDSSIRATRPIHACDTTRSYCVVFWGSPVHTSAKTGTEYPNAHTQTYKHTQFTTHDNTHSYVHTHARACTHTNTYMFSHSFARAFSCALFRTRAVSHALRASFSLDPSRSLSPLFSLSCAFPAWIRSHWANYSRVPGHRNHRNDPASVFLSTHWWSQHPACQRWLFLVVSCFYKPLRNCHPSQRISKVQCEKLAKKFFYIEISC